MQRGDVWWADLPAPVGRRPVLLLSRNQAYSVRNAVTVAFLTTTIRSIPVEVRVTPADGVPKDSVVNLDLVNTIPKSALRTKICALSTVRMRQVETAIRSSVGRWTCSPAPPSNPVPIRCAAPRSCHRRRSFMPRDRESIADILASARLILGYVAGKSLRELQADMQCQNAVIRRFEIIGEAAKR